MRKVQDPGHIQTPLRLLMEHTSNSTANTLIGVANVQKGERLPVKGYSSHVADEYSYVLRGLMTIETAQGTTRGGPGTLLLIPAGEAHAVYAHEDCEVLWWWVGSTQEFELLKAHYPLAGGEQ